MTMGSKAFLYYSIVFVLFVKSAFAIYCPETGRFLQRDPIGVDPAGGKMNPYSVRAQYTDTADLYVYAGNRPCIIIDPFGLEDSNLYPSAMPIDDGEYLNSDSSVSELGVMKNESKVIRDRKKLTKKYTKTVYQKDCIDEIYVYGHGSPDSDVTIGGKEAFNPLFDVPSGNLCCVATVWLNICYSGKLEDQLRHWAESIAKRNPGKRIYVCGCDNLYMENRVCRDSLSEGCTGRWVCKSAKY